MRPGQRASRAKKSRSGLGGPTGIPSDWQQVENFLDTIQELTRERDEARASIAAAHREAAEHIRRRATFYRERGDTIRNLKAKDDFYNMAEGLDGISEQIEKLTAPIAIRAEKRLLAQARLDTANAVWLSWVRKDQVVFTEWLSEYISGLTAALAEIDKETPDGQ